MILPDARDAFVRYCEDPSYGCPDETSVRDNQRATGFFMLCQLLQLLDCSCLQLQERLAARRPMVREAFGPGPRVLRVLKLDFFPRQSLPFAEVHLPQGGRSHVAEAEMFCDRFGSFFGSP